MQVHVKHLLHRGFAICQKEVDALALDATPANRCGHTLRFLHQTTGNCRVEVGEIRCVMSWNDQHVAWIDRLDIHECRTFRVAKKKCRGQLSR
jgi:hypothetical protein